MVSNRCVRMMRVAAGWTLSRRRGNGFSKHSHVSMASATPAWGWRFTRRDRCLSAGGDGRYVVSIFLGDRNKVLCDPTKSEDDSEWVVCGQGSSYPSSMVVDEQSARQAMLNFFDTGGLWDPTLFWDEM